MPENVPPLGTINVSGRVMGSLDEVGGDVIGRIYEYFLNKFAKNIASDDSVFFTPKSLVKLIVNILEPTSGVPLEITSAKVIQLHSLDECRKVA